MFDCAVPPDPIQSAANICPELTAGLPADQFEHIIIAGMDDDISTADMLDWVYPVLVAIPGGRWSSCEIEFQSGTPVRVRYRSGKTSIQIDDPTFVQPLRANLFQGDGNSHVLVWSRPTKREAAG